MKILPQARNLCIGIALFLGITFDAEAQITQDYLQQFIEFITENQDGGEEFDYSEIGEQLDDWSRSPIDINSPEAAILVQWKIISDNAYRNLQDHIYQTWISLSCNQYQDLILK